VKPSRVAVAALAALVVGGGPRSVQAADDAAAVNETPITVDEFEDFVTALPEAGFSDFAADASSLTVGGDPGRAALTLLVTNEAHRQFFDQLGIAEPSAEELDEAMAQTPDDHPIRQNPVVYDAVAADAAYRARLDTLEPDVATMREQYEESPASLGVYCATAVNVASDEDADAVVAAVEGGATADDAAAGVTGASVSDWQCTPLSSVADPVLVADLAEAAPGEAIGPVRTGDGPAVLVVDDFETAAPKLENFFLRLEEDGGETTAGFVLFQGFLLGADITVNPRYGRWDPTTGSIVALGT
jgi:hypothetical protein